MEALSWEYRWVGDKNWTVGGDFKEVTSLEEKKGEQQTLGNINEYFRDFIEENNLVDVKIRNV